MDEVRPAVARVLELAEKHGGLDVLTHCDHNICRDVHEAASLAEPLARGVMRLSILWCPVCKTTGLTIIHGNMCDMCHSDVETLDPWTLLQERDAALAEVERLTEERADLGELLGNLDDPMRAAADLHEGFVEAQEALAREGVEYVGGDGSLTPGIAHLIDERDAARRLAWALKEAVECLLAFDGDDFATAVSTHPSRHRYENVVEALEAIPVEWQPEDGS